MPKALYADSCWGTNYEDTVAFVPNFSMPGYPYRGIYPRCLNVELEQDNRCIGAKPGGLPVHHEPPPVHHQDVLIYFDRRSGGNGTTISRFLCKVYDKKIKLMAAGAKLIYYPHASSMLSEQCKYGIVFSSAYRYFGHCTILQDFQTEMINIIKTLVLKKEYRITLCMAQLKRFALKYPNIYGTKRFWQVIAPVIHYFSASGFNGYQ
jgi:hypothetical protein